MAWEARSGLKQPYAGEGRQIRSRLNGLGSPFGIETCLGSWAGGTGDRGLNGLGSPFGIETGPVVKGHVEEKGG